MKEENDQFEHFVRGVYPTAVRTAYLITGSPEEAMDLAQEAFIRAFTRWGRVSRLDRPDRWVQRVVTNLAISWRRRQGARLRALNRLGGQGTNPIEWDEEPDAGAIAALQRLPLAQRSVLVLRYCLDWSTEEVATALRKRPGTVRALAWQGLDRLRRELQDQERMRWPMTMGLRPGFAAWASPPFRRLRSSTSSPRGSAADAFECSRRLAAGWPCLACWCGHSSA